VGTITTGTWSGTAIAVAKGGTGASTATPNYVFAGPSSGSTPVAPSFRALVASDFPTLNQSTTGNAATATKLATTKNINGTAFDGSSDITVTADAGTLTGTTLKSTVVTSSLTTVGTIGTGNWQGSAIAGQFGGTGVNNSGKTITLGGNITTAGAFTTSGAFATTLTSSGATNVTLPTSGTLATLAGTESLSNKTFTGSTTLASASVTGAITAKNYITTVPANITAAATTTLDFSTGNILKVSLGANITALSVTFATAGTYLLEIIQGAAYTVAFPAAWKWSGGTVPTITTTANKTDIITIVYDGSTYFASAVQNF
jgi:hypothetical protein